MKILKLKKVRVNMLLLIKKMGNLDKLINL